MTRTEAAALAGLLRTIRPAWDELATINVLATHAGRDLADVAYAAIRTAQDPTMRTPNALTFTDSPHWRPTARTTAETAAEREERQARQLAEREANHRLRAQQQATADERAELRAAARANIRPTVRLETEETTRHE